jgi:hypothetical protein
MIGCESLSRVFTTIFHKAGASQFSRQEISFETISTLMKGGIHSFLNALLRQINNK